MKKQHWLVTNLIVVATLLFALIVPATFVFADTDVEPAPDGSLWLRIEPNEGSPTVDTEAGRMAPNATGKYAHPILGWVYEMVQKGRASLGVGLFEDQCIFMQTGDILLTVESSWGQKFEWEDPAKKSWKSIPELVGSGTITYTGLVSGYKATKIVVTGVKCGKDNAIPTIPATEVPNTPPATATPVPPTLTPTLTPTPVKVTTPEPAPKCLSISGLPTEGLPAEGIAVTLTVTAPGASLVRLVSSSSIVAGPVNMPSITGFLFPETYYEVQVAGANGQFNMTDVCRLSAPTGEEPVAEPTGQNVIYLPVVKR